MVFQRIGSQDVNNQALGDQARFFVQYINACSIKFVEELFGITGLFLLHRFNTLFTCVVGSEDHNFW
jgi:hypothetical protein